ncbi:myeloid differentiation primary response protein MyD88-like [Tropilaelaps mercedesae]|uniref:Myeloid differentiation primary response protein MyD88-like n=1 Tax=Tropilaelaps mercedesae TaxID=418985 RepID=A0A1V9XFF5_9ACAR|nr:myeloid differentiation primary response protein MyD88-like [Tropilaelaps mercedesae]
MVSNSVYRSIVKTKAGKKGNCRDWRLLAELVLPHERLQQLQLTQDPLAETLKAWPSEATIGHVLTALEAVERFDVIDDCIESIQKDCKDFQNRRRVWGMPSSVHATCFQAFVVHAQTDNEFVKQLIDRLEKKEGLSLFIPVRDFPAAMANYLYKLMQVMDNQCRKIIIVISKALAADDNATQLLEKAEQLRAQQMQTGFTSSRIIPVILEDCPVVGSSLISISPVNFRSHPEWAWPKLISALKM